MPSKKRLDEVLHLGLKEVLLLYALKEYGPIGRGRLTDVLSLPEGVTRGLLTRLQGKHYVSADKPGCSITEKGVGVLAERLSKLQVRSIRGYEGVKLNVGPVNVAVHIGGASGKVRLGIEERDTVIRAGAKGAITLTYRGGVLSIPGICERLEEYRRDAWAELMSSFDLREGDLVLVVFADDYWKALDGALAVASTYTEGSTQP